MTRGNQRDIDRERARKRAEANGPGEKKGDFNKRRETDAEIMRRKQEEAIKRKAESENYNGVEESKGMRKKIIGWIIMFVLGLWGIVMDVKLLTLNLFLRPPGIKTNYSDYKDLRTNVFLEDYLDSFDLICLQEVFDPLSDRKQKILKTAESRGFFSKTSSSPRWSKGHFIDSGLLILSKFPILESDEIVYTDGKGVDGLCAKGGLYIKVCISNKFVHIFTTHLQAAYFTEDFNTFLQYRIIKKKQLIELKAFVDGKTRNCKDVVFVAGDFNVDGRENMKKQMFEKDVSWEYEEFRSIFGGEFNDLIRDIYGHSLATFAVLGDNGEPLERVLTAPDELGQDECLDYILVKNQRQVEIDKENTKVDHLFVKRLPVTQISDHSGVVCSFRINDSE